MTVATIGTQISGGFLYLSDRRVDMFTVGGRNVYPAEIENALSAHPEVLSCLVVGVPDVDMGQLPYALVHTLAGASLDAVGIRRFVGERLAAYKVPRIVEFVAAVRDAVVGQSQVGGP